MSVTSIASVQTLIQKQGDNALAGYHGGIGDVFPNKVDYQFMCGGQRGTYRQYRRLPCEYHRA
jgi:type 1 glutamine amidotransferase